RVYSSELAAERDERVSDPSPRQRPCAVPEARNDVANMRAGRSRPMRQRSLDAHSELALMNLTRLIGFKLRECVLDEPQFRFIARHSAPPAVMSSGGVSSFWGGSSAGSAPPPPSPGSFAGAGSAGAIGPIIGAGSGMNRST